MFCTQCGNQLKESDQFCTRCGHKIQQNTAAMVPAHTPIPNTIPSYSAPIQEKILAPKDDDDHKIASRIVFTLFGLGMIVCIMAAIIRFS